MDPNYQPYSSFNLNPFNDVAIGTTKKLKHNRLKIFGHGSYSSRDLFLLYSYEDSWNVNLMVTMTGIVVGIHGNYLVLGLYLGITIEVFLKFKSFYMEVMKYDTKMTECTLDAQIVWLILSRF